MSLKQLVEKEGFYVEDPKRLDRPRRVCVRSTACDQWKGTDCEGYVWCDDYCSGWCKHSFKGVPEGEPLIPVSKVKEWRDKAAASAETGDKILDRIRTAVQEMLANKIMPEPVTLSDFLKVAEFFLYGKVLVSKEVFGGGAEKE